MIEKELKGILQRSLKTLKSLEHLELLFLTPNEKRYIGTLTNAYEQLATAIIAKNF